MSNDTWFGYSINAKDTDGKTVEVQQVGFRGGKSAVLRLMDEFTSAMLD